MNLRAYPPRKADARRAGFRLVLWLFPAVAISAPSVAPEIFGPASRPYLPATGAPALRFGDAPPPPPLWVRPAAGAPPNVTVEDPAPDTSTGAAASRPSEPDPTAVATTPDAVPAPANAPPVKTPPPILPDDTRPKVRAEDFLPFFQFPGSASAAGDVSVVVPVTPGGAPAPAPQPRSSATYRQQ